MAYRDAHYGRICQKVRMAERRRADPTIEQRGRKQRHGRRRVLIELFKDVPCVRCGGEFPACAMDFHHRDPTQKLVSSGLLWGCSIDRFLAEMEKCDVICANCHRIITHVEKELMT